MKSIIIIGLLLVSGICYGDIYVAIDKETGQVVGSTDVQPESIGEWNKTYTMKKTDESFRGKQGFEIKFENKKLRLATEKEIEDYLKEKEKAARVNKRKQLLEDLGMTEEQLLNLKTQ